MNAVICAMGGYVPSNVIKNEQIAGPTGKSADWFEKRTGIQERRWADPGVPTSMLAEGAVTDMRERFPGALDDVTEIVLTTSTPDRPQPPTAAILQDLIGLPGVPASDLNAVCAGWMFGFKHAAALVQTQPGKVLLVAADKYSGILDATDPTTVSLFGDGAGAVVIEWGDEAGSGLLSLERTTNGELFELVTVRAGGSERPRSSQSGDYLFKMLGKDVRAYVLNELPVVILRACAQAGIHLDEIGTFVCHQANVRLLEDLAKTMGVDFSRFTLTAPKFGNTGSASLPLTLLKALDDGQLVPGRPVALCAVGGGMSLAAGIYVP